MQRLVVKAYNAFPDPEFDASVQSEFQAALSMTMVSIRDEVEKLKKDLPLDIQSHCEFIHD